MKRDGHRLIWEDADIEYLRENCGKISMCDIAFELHISQKSVRKKAIELNLEMMCNKIYWTDEMTEYLVGHYPNETYEYMAAHLGLSVTSIVKKSKELGLNRSDGYDRRIYNRRYSNNYDNAV